MYLHVYEHHLCLTFLIESRNKDLIFTLKALFMNKVYGLCLTLTLIKNSEQIEACSETFDHH